MPGPENTNPATSPDRDAQSRPKVLPSMTDDEIREAIKLRYLLRMEDLQAEFLSFPDFDRNSLDSFKDLLRASTRVLDDEFRPRLEALREDVINEIAPSCFPNPDNELHFAISNRFEVDPTQTNVKEGEDPVDLFSGNFVYAATDFQINGAGLDFIFVRTYSQLASYPGPLGHNWDHAYNLWLVVEDGGQLLRRSTGMLREQLFRKHEQHDYWIPPDGVFGVLVENGESFVFRFPDGTRIFYQPHQTLHPRIHVVARIEDRFGNNLDFSYSEGLLSQVQVNHAQRVVGFQYDTEDRITSISDFSGRTWSYYYDDLGDLVAVTTPGTAQHRKGLTTCYEYVGTLSSDPNLKHSLTAIIDADGQTYLENEFGTEPNLLSYRRVVRQRQGGGEASFDYADVIEDFQFTYESHERPAHQTIVTKRDGVQVRYLFNKFGNMIFSEAYARIGGVPKLVSSHYRYNRDGNQVGVISPLGVIVQALYERDIYERQFPPDNDHRPEDDSNLTERARRGFNNLLAVVRRGNYHDVNSLNLAGGLWSTDIFPDILQTNDQDAIQKFTYEPEFSQPFTVSDPRFTRSADPAFSEDAEYDRHLTKYSYAPGRGFQHFLLESIEFPTPVLPDGTLSEPVTIRYPEYDDNGRLVRALAPNNLETLNTYVGSVEGILEGFLKTTTVDPGGFNIKVGLDLDQLGRIVKLFRPSFFDFNDHRFFSTYEYDELSQLVKSTGTAPFSITTHVSYARTGNVARAEIELKDQNNSTVGALVTSNRYDQEFNLTSLMVGDSENKSVKKSKFIFDQAARPFLAITPSGRKRKRSFNERSLLSKTIEDYGGVHAVTRGFYDADNRLERTIDARGFVTKFAYDVFGRLVDSGDAKGNRVIRHFDKIGNLLVECLYEKLAENAFVLLFRREFSYDELGRMIVSAVNKFDHVSPITAIELENAFLESGPGELLSNQCFYDNIGNVVKEVDHDGRAFISEYDLLGRVTHQTDPNGNEVRVRYDKESNIVRVERKEVARDAATNSVTATRHFAETLAYDELNRLVERRTSTGRFRFRYDSRGNCVETEDPLGNRMDNSFDVFDRLVETNRFLHNFAENAVPVPVGTRFGYNLDDQKTAQTDALGRTTRFQYDSAGRLTATFSPDGSSDALKYDRLGNLTEYRDRKGVIRKLTWDELNRNTDLQIDASTPASDVSLVSATSYHAEYDAMGRFKTVENDFVVNRFDYNSLTHLNEETTSFTERTGINPAKQFTIRREFNSSGKLIGFTYPSGRELTYSRDILDRITRVEQVRKGDGYPGDSTTPDNLTIAAVDYEGLQVKKISRHNNTSTQFKYDFAGRAIEIAHASGANNVLTLQFLYDALGNMRQKTALADDYQITQALRYDSLSQVLETANSSGASLLDLSAIAPPNVPLPEDIPNQQLQIDQLVSPSASQEPRLYEHDLAGNRISLTAGGAVENYETNELDQYTTVNDAVLRYDQDGNLIEDEAFFYGYDHQNQLCRIKAKDDADEIRFFFDFFGRRVLQSEGEGQLSRVFLFDEHNLLEQYDGEQLIRSVVSNTQPDGFLLSSSGGHDYYLLSDLTGSVNYLFDGAEKHNFYIYDEFGNLADSLIPVDDNPFRFAGKTLLGKSGKYDFVFRSYDPSIGRFMQRDPKGFVDGTNLYTFLRNNPLVFSDPLGLESRPENAAPVSQPIAKAPVNSTDDASGETTGGGDGVIVSMDRESLRERRDYLTAFENFFTGESKWFKGKFVPTDFEKTFAYKGGEVTPIFRKGASGIDDLVGWREIAFSDGYEGTLWYDVTREGVTVTAGGRPGSGSMTPGFLASMLDPSNFLVGKLATAFLSRAVARSGVSNFVFRSIAQESDNLALWNQALRTVASDAESTYARTLGQRLTSMEGRLAFDEVNAVFFRLRGIAGAGTHNMHHWNPLSHFPEFALDPRNLFLVDSAIQEGSRVGSHIFLHWVTRTANPWRGPFRPGAILDLGWARSVLEPLE